MTSIFFRTAIIFVILSICMKVMGKREIGELEVASKIDILLQQNDTYMNIKNKMIKKAERTDLWSAIDIGAFWLEDALKHA